MFNCLCIDEAVASPFGAVPERSMQPPAFGLGLDSESDEEDDEEEEEPEVAENENEVKLCCLSRHGV